MKECCEKWKDIGGVRLLYHTHKHLDMPTSSIDAYNFIFCPECGESLKPQEKMGYNEASLREPALRRGEMIILIKVIASAMLIIGSTLVLLSVWTM